MQWKGGGALHAVLFPAAPKRCLVDAQDLGRLLQRLRGGKHTADMFFLDLFQACQVSRGGSRLRAGEGPGKNLDADSLRPAQDGGPFDDVAQFPEVPRPRVAFHRLHRLFREPGEAAVVNPPVESEQLRRERLEILGAFAQRRDLDLDDVQAIEKILPEPPRLHLPFQVPVGGRDDADVGLARRWVAEPLVLLVLQETQQLGLQGKGEIPDLVEEERSPLAGGDASRVVADRSGERTFHVSEQLAFQQLRRQGGARHHAERFPGAPAPAVDRAGQDGFPGPALAPKEHRGVGSRDPPGHFHGALHGGAIARKTDLRGRPLQVLPEGRHLLLQRPHFLHFPHGEQDLGRRERFRDVVGRPPAHRLHGRVDRSVRGDDDDLHPWTSREEHGDQVQAARRAQAEIDERQVEGATGRLRDGVLEVADGGHVVAFGFQADGEGLPDVALVVDDENVDGSAGRRRSGHGLPSGGTRPIIPHRQVPGVRNIGTND